MSTRILIISVVALSFAPVGFAAEDTEFFEAKVRPLLAKRCYECHRRKAEGGLRLDSLQGMLKGGSTGPAIIAGDASASLLWQVVSRKHEDIAMPPENPLSVSEVKIFEKWITSGAHWPMAIPSARTTLDESGISAEERAFWSFQPISKPRIPDTDGSWGEHPVDAFIARRHQQHRLTPTAAIGPRKLIRRVTYDLIGLPPTPEEVAGFQHASLQDSKAAYADLVERLLASKHYGERWAQHWLDLVRYADTAGDAADFPIPEAYKYRNYVIDAFNNDKPYDQFVREQIAGDLMPAENDEESWRRVVATGYIAISRRIGVSPHGQRHITIEDTLNNLGKTFLGLSIGCARCHDHKFDPIPTADYYALYGIFDSTAYPHAGAEHKPYRSDFVYRIGDEASDEVLASYRKELEPWHEKERAAFERYRDFQRKPINIPGYNRDVAWQEVLDLREEIRKVAATFPNLEIAFAASEGDCNDVHVQKQGDPRDRGPLIRRGFLQILGGQTLADDVTQSGRLQLAEWITEPANPLTARVIANRVWHHHFGRGLVASTSDFGVRGSLPSHPELLDFLATYLIENDWSIKQLHRLIVSSQTYQLASDDVAANTARDPENVYLWRGNRRRLDAEQLRDSILAFSNQLDPSTGEAHPFPHRLTYFFRQHEPYVGDFPSNRRTIYLFRQRIRKNRYLDMFDGPDGNLHVGTRRPTTTSLQSLYLMNSSFIDDQSQAIAQRVIASSDSHTERVGWAYRNIFGREPNADDVRMIEANLDRSAAQLSDEANDRIVVAWTSMIRAMLCSNEFVFVD
ncbi:MAG: PSD1 domain-containing protein [Planctomycetes bacterium]|nr:PSD1 domain-containing protein [Planctomycetota bacterium]